MHNRTDGLIPGVTTLQLVSKYGDALAKQRRDKDRERRRNIDVSDAPEWALELASRYKELSVLEKADAAWRLHNENRWTQAKIGKLFGGVTGSAVQNWMKHAEDPGYVARRRASRAAWREQNRYGIATYHREWGRRSQGDDLRSWRAATWQAQDGRCYLCERPMGPDLMAVIEHDHRCCPNGKSCAICRRGLACERCNWLLGLAGDDPDLLELAARNFRPVSDAVTARLAGQGS